MKYTVCKDEIAKFRELLDLTFYTFIKSRWDFFEKMILNANEALETDVNQRTFNGPWRENKLTKRYRFTVHLILFQHLQ